MASPARLQRLQTLIWVLIFGGLLGVVYGLALQPYAHGAGLLFIIGGAVLAGLGAVLIAVRARLRSDHSGHND